MELAFEEESQSLSAQKGLKNDKSDKIVNASTREEVSENSGDKLNQEDNEDGNCLNLNDSSSEEEELRQKEELEKQMEAQKKIMKRKQDQRDAEGDGSHMYNESVLSKLNRKIANETRQMREMTGVMGSQDEGGEFVACEDGDDDLMGDCDGKKLNSQGLTPRYCEDPGLVDLDDPENQLRYLVHIDLAKDKIQNQKKFKIGNFDVYFPMLPYQCQKNYMEKVIEACHSGKNALLESPTGTGKTLCLLTASLAWLKRIRETKVMSEADMPRIIYCSRTHSQISQVANELKHTVYEPKMCLIGSRDQLCVNPKLKDQKGMALNAACKKAREANKHSPHGCNYFRNVGEKVQPNSFPWDHYDIEDLHKMGLKHKVCPYYLQKNRVQHADLVLMPYNYLIDPKIRENFKIGYENSIIIMDEAHNVEKVAEDVASFEINLTSLFSVIAELSNLASSIENSSGEKTYQSNLKNINEILTMTRNFQNYIKEFDIKCSKRLPINEIKDEDAVYHGKQVFEFFFEGSRFTDYSDYKGPGHFEGIKPSNFGHWYYIFEKCMADLTENTGDRPCLDRWWDAVKKVMRLHKQLYSQGDKLHNGESMDNMAMRIQNNKHSFFNNEIEHYFVFIRQETIKIDLKLKLPPKEIDQRKRAARTIGFWCFNPGLGFKRVCLLKPRSIILTSGTLSPMDSFEQELLVEFPVKICNKHVVKKEQAKVSILTHGVGRMELNFSHKYREQDIQIKDLGETLIKLTQVTPGGMLFFFPSYVLLQKLYDAWDETGVIKRMERIKGVYQEPRESSHYKFVISAFYKDVYRRGAIMFAVCRGKISEGLDFSDDAARCVVLIGIPYPQVVDPKTLMKRHYLDNKLNICGLTGQQWYCQQATRATNQAIGRVIRHKEDYGNIVLIDSRFSAPKQVEQISSWLRDNITIYSDADQFCNESKQFYTTMKSRGFIPKVKQLDQVKFEFNEIDEDPDLRAAIKDIKAIGGEKRMDPRLARRKVTPAPLGGEKRQKTE